MKNPLKIRLSTVFLMFLTQISWSKGVSAECPKFSESLCADFKTKSNNDTIYVEISLKDPFAPRPDSCQNVVLKTHPECEDKMDSAFWVRVKEETMDFYAKYSSMMMDVKNPSQVLPYPGDSAGIFSGAIVTKMDLITISQDTSVQEVSVFYTYPLYLIKQKIIARPNQNWLNFSVNGQVIPSITPAKNIVLRVPRK